MLTSRSTSFDAVVCIAAVKVREFVPLACPSGRDACLADGADLGMSAKRQIRARVPALNAERMGRRGPAWSVVDGGASVISHTSAE